MTWLRTILREVFGLFVDDGSFAFAIVIWLVVVKLVSPHLGMAALRSGFILFGGLAAILIRSVLHASQSSPTYADVATGTDDPT